MGGNLSRTMRPTTPPNPPSVIVDSVLCDHHNVYIKGRERKGGPPPHHNTHTSTPHTSIQHPSFNESEAGEASYDHMMSAPPLFSLTFDGDYVLSDLVLQGQVIDALDQVVDRVNVGVDRLEPMDLCPDGR